MPLKPFVYIFSYICHLTEGLALVLTGDYELGAMAPEGKVPECKGDAQFEEKVCRHKVDRALNACNGQVRVDLYEEGWEPIAQRHAAYDAVFWGAGRHGIPEYHAVRNGVHNAFAVIQYRLRPLCRANEAWLLDRNHNRSRLYWVTSHVRLIAAHPDERPSVVLKYNEEMMPAARKFQVAPNVARGRLRQAPDHSTSCVQVTYVGLPPLTCTVTLRRYANSCRLMHST
jgi:hypothetical protein